MKKVIIRASKSDYVKQNFSLEDLVSELNENLYALKKLGGHVPEEVDEDDPDSMKFLAKQVKEAQKYASNIVEVCDYILS